MPARDGTGPSGTGPVGRGLGACRGNEQEFGYDQPYGLGLARRWGRKAGNRHPRWGRRANNPGDDLQGLQSQQSWLKEQLNALSRRIEDLHKSSG